MRFLPPFLLGFIAISYQILLLREFDAQFYGNELTFGLVLASWLLWGGLGSLAASRFKFRPEQLPRVYNLVIVLFPFCLLVLRFSRFALGILPGELTGLGPVLSISLGLCFLISFPLGALFVFNVCSNQGRIDQVYVLESLGAAASGLLVYLILLPRLSHWQAASLIGICSSLLISLSFGQKKRKHLILLLGIYLLGFSLFDLPSQRIYWRPFQLIETRDTRYGRLQVIRTQEQISLYSNSLHIYSYPDLAAAEESVHFALLQNPEANAALLIGGGAGGSLREILKYPHVELDYVELDPEIIRLSNRLLPIEEKRYLSHERVHLFLEDGRAFLQRTRKKYDVIILNLPDPATAQVNRFYTADFFRLVKLKLAPDGVFSFTVSGAENYISPELQQFLSSLHETLTQVFSEVRVVPGDRNIFLASFHPLSIDPAELCRRAESYRLQNVTITSTFLYSRLHPLRRSYLEERLKSETKQINSDLKPISFFFYSVLWSTHFKGWESKVFKFFSELPLFWLLDFPLLLFILLLFYFWKKRKKSSYFLTPLAVMGFTTIVTEIILLIWFQALYGYLYGRIAILFSSFMFGLFIGSWMSSRRKAASSSRMVALQFGFFCLLLVLQFIIKMHPPEFFAFAFLLLLGYLGGDLFVVSNRLYLLEKANYGVGYGLDLGGSFLGALATSSLLIPLAGLFLLVRYVFLLNSFCLLFLLTRPRKSRSVMEASPNM